ncbi:MAG: hypothetical protein ACKN9V_07635 [Pseudomonadota bacterium]
MTVDALFARLRLSNETVSGVGIQGNINVGLSERFGLGVSLGHALTIPASTLFIQIGLEAKWALTGTLYSKVNTVQSENKSILKSESGKSGGIRLHGFIHEYIVNRNYLTKRYSGIGAALSYEFPSRTNLVFRLGLRGDYAFRENDSLLALQAFGGAGLRF